MLNIGSMRGALSTFLLLLLLVLNCLAINVFNGNHDNNDDDDVDNYADHDTNKHIPPTSKSMTMCVCRKRYANTLYTIDHTACNSNDKRVAVGKFTDAITQTGWGILEIRTTPTESSMSQAYSAGIIEGHLAREQIRNHYRNTVEGMCKEQEEYCKKLQQYLRENLDWIKQMLHSKPHTDVYWNQVNLTLMQLTGMEHGYNNNNAMKPEISFQLSDIYMIQLSGEFIDLEKKFGRKKMPGDDVEASKCSGFVKVAPKNSDLFIAHVSMSGYNTMNRVLKLYNFAFNSNKVNTVAFSAYPASLASLDDFVLTSSGLAAIETTFAIFNQSLYSDRYVKSKDQLHCWIRSVIASRLALNAREWITIFARYNSGTYNNQWTVLDYNKFEPGKPLPSKDLLWVLEQAPGLVIARDMSTFLINHTYWPSYNIPYFEEMTTYSGYAQKAAENNWYKWGASPRARIFERDHHKVDSLEQLQKLMRYNNYKHDEYSRCKCVPPYTAEGGISSRGDLNPANGTYEVESMGHRNHGGIDYKGTNLALSKLVQFRTIGGPTYDPLPVFSWSTTDIVANHYGQPIVWNFTEFQTNWVL